MNWNDIGGKDLKLKAKKLFKKMGWKNFIGSGSQEITHITQDSRKAGNNSVFLARKGFKSDGHKFISEAYEKGTRVFIVEKFPEELQPDATYIKVENSNSVLAPVSAEIYDHPQKELKLYGVTGTNGKTTTCFILYDLLNKIGIKTGLLGTIKVDLGNKEIKPDRTTPEASEIYRYLACMRDNNCERVVMEVSSHALKLNRVECLTFDSVIFTNISQDHLDFHEDMSDYLNTKLSLFNLLAENDGKALFNKDDDLIRDAVEESENWLYSFSLDCESDFEAKNIQLYSDQGLFELNEEEYKFPMPGRYNIYNAVSALGALLVENFDSNVLSRQLADFSGVPGRLEKIDNSREFSVFIDYAHTPAGIENVLTSIRELQYNNLKVVFGCGGDRDIDKRPKMGRVALRFADEVIITTDNPRSEKPEDIIDDIISDINFSKYNTHWEIVVEREDAIFKAISRAEPNDIIIIFGKGHETTQDFGDRVIEFDDRKKAKDAINARN